MGGQSTAPTKPVSNPQTGEALGVVMPLWKYQQEFSLLVAISESEHFDVSHMGSDGWLIKHDNLKFNWENYNFIEQNLSIPASLDMQRNGSMYAHIFLLKPGYSLDSSASNYHYTSVVKKTVKMNLHRPKIKEKTGKNLLDKSEKPMEEVPVEIERDKDEPWVSYWRPVLNVRLVHDFSTIKLNTLPPEIAEGFDIDYKTSRYFPTLYIDYFWMLRDRMILLNETVKELPLEFSFSPIALWKWQLQTQMDVSWKRQESWGSTEAETDQFRRILLEANPYLLAVTAVVSIFHMVFDFLAFKNDVTFWKDKKNLEGLSVRTIFINCFCQVVIFLYLVDNETSWMILISSFVGIVIEFWKITKASDVSVVRKNVFGVQIPWVKFEDKKSYIDSHTSQYDQEAMRYLSWALYPLIICYAIYSLIYDTHKSWYSWILSSLTGSVYAFGFILMCPQLYLNYKLKSVAHLPWRMMTYKALNTFIDDLFAFIIKMPILHRIACFRDDVVFFIYLYQRWIYRVDYTRTNEFGYTPEEEKASDEKAQKTHANDPAKDNTEKKTCSTEEEPIPLTNPRKKKAE